MYLLGAVLLSGLAVALSKETCCEQIGCYQTDGPFRHMPTPACPETFGVKTGLFTRNNRNDAQFLERTGAIPSSFSNARRSIFIIHGYLNSMKSDYMIYIKDAILKTEDANVFLVDWKKGANNVFYPSSAANTRTTGAEVALRMDRLVNEAGLSRTNLWCVGFSLGAHTCGFAGMATKIQRVTGLDPAGPWFDGYEPVARLNPTVATLVDVMHTDGTGIAAYYGLITPQGHMDFYPNGGTNQPGCWTSININGTLASGIVDTGTMGDISVSCSHMRAVRFFEKSTVRGCYVSRQICENERKLPKSCSSCPQGVCGEMGYHADQYPAHGKFYLETSSKSPYCRY